MKKRTLLALLMVLPLVGCAGNNNSNNNVVPPIVDDGGEGGEGGGQGGGGGEDHKDPVEVKQSELLDTLKTIAKNLFHEEEVEGADYWDGASKLYGVYESSMHQKTSSYKWENALDDLKGSLPTGYTVKDNRTQVKYNEINALQENYLVSNKIEVDAWAYTFTYEEGGKSQDWVYIDFEIKAAANTTFVDDIKEENKTVTVTFLNNGFSGSFENANKEAFKEWFNDKAGCEDLLSEITIDGYAQVTEVAKGHTTMILGSGSSDAKVTFKFNYDVLAIKVGVQAYWNSWTQGGVDHFNVDSQAKAYINSETDIIDLSTSDTSKEPEIKDVERTFETPIKSYYLGADGGKNTGRVFVNYMTITYEAQ